MEDIYKPNTDPKKRFVSFSFLSQVKSIQNGNIVAFMTKNQVIKLLEGDQSDAVDRMFDNPATIDMALIGCRYDNKNHESRRRFITTNKPENDDELRDLIATLADTLGITLNFHSFEKTTASVGKLEKISIVVKEEKLLFDELISAYLRQNIKAEAVDKQLAGLKEKIIHGTALNLVASEQSGYALGYLLQEYLDRKTVGQPSNVYRVAEKFGRHLSKTKISIPSKYLKLPRSGSFLLFEFPFTFQIGSESYLRNTVIGLTPNATGILIIAPIYKGGQWDGSFIECVWPLPEEDILIDDIPQEFTTNTSFDLKEYLLYCLKCIVYTHSAEPDLENVTPPKCDKKNPAKIRKFYKNLCPYDITNLGYSYHGRTYAISETEVSGHFRWQPCGKEKSEVKLIWIDEHTRTYNNDTI